MAIINGTDSDDILIGTDQDDFFRPKSGYDKVDGGVGIDKLSVDYSVYKASSFELYPYATLGPDGFSGVVSSRISNDHVEFSRIEILDVRFGIRNDSFRLVVETPQLEAASVRIDAGGGVDTLYLVLQPIGRVVFKVDQAGNVSNNFGSRFTGFEDYNLELGAGDHVIALGEGSDRVSLASGSSRVKMGGGRDYVASQGGRDIIDGGAGRDHWIILTAGTTEARTLSVNGLTQTASLSNGSRAVNVEGVDAELGDGNDVIRLTDRADADVKAGGGNDRFVVTNSASVHIDGGAGQDTATLSGLTSYIYTRLERDPNGGLSGRLGQVSLASIEKLTATLSDLSDRIEIDGNAVLTDATLTLNGGLGNDIMSLDFSGATMNILFVPSGDGAYRIANSIFRGFESLSVKSGVGNDELTGGIGDDVLNGGAGNDTLHGGAGSDILEGGDGNDQLVTGGGGGTARGGAGDDIYYLSEGDNPVNLREYAGEGYDTIMSSIDAWLPDNFERLELTGTDDLFGGGFNGDDIILGNAGSNWLRGEGGNDILSGAAGNDQLWGWRGANRLSGGSGGDIFWFDVKESSVLRDIITDFEPGMDSIIFLGREFGGLAQGSLPANAFAIGSSASTAEQHFLYDPGNGRLYYDADGVGATDPTLVAILSNIPQITAADIGIA
ncbi:MULTISPECIES: calcium-binding protein [unclassified Sphingobium]|uniref:calcium-binding protein n=1 Tax=unclassified Sphingobium TaxID=2611147 RepID=UPI0035A62672